jgi:flavodoxin
MAKNIIFYFTGTGNSLKAAKDIASVLGDTELVFMKGNYELIGTYERIGFVFPCYAGGAPKAVMKFVRSLELSSTSADYLFAVVTCNESGANSLPMLHAELAKKDLALNYGEVLPVVGNYIVLYDLPNNQEQRLQTAERKTRDIADDIQRKGVKQIGKKRLPFSAFYAIGNQFFKAKEKLFLSTEFWPTNPIQFWPTISSVHSLMQDQYFNQRGSLESALGSGIPAFRIVASKSGTSTDVCVTPRDLHASENLAINALSIEAGSFAYLCA